MDASKFRANSNFNFSFYPQRVEKVLEKYEGKVSIKNKFTDKKIFINSDLRVEFLLKQTKFKFKQKTQKENIGSFN